MIKFLKRSFLIITLLPLFSLVAVEQTTTTTTTVKTDSTTLPTQTPALPTKTIPYVQPVTPYYPSYHYVPNENAFPNKAAQDKLYEQNKQKPPGQ